MNLAPNDILLNGPQSLWVSERMLTDICGVSSVYLSNKVRPKYGKIHREETSKNSETPWKFQKIDRRFYYDFDRLPKKNREILGSKAELIAKCELLKQQADKEAQKIVKANILWWIQALTDGETRNYFQYKAPFTFNIEKADQMAQAKAWLDFIIQRIEKDDFELHFQIPTQKAFLNLCAELIGSENLEGLKIKTYNGLYSKLGAYRRWIKHCTEQENAQEASQDKDDIRDFFISRRYGNNNRQIVGKHPIVDENTGEVLKYDIHQVLISYLYMNPKSSAKEPMYRLWKRYCKDLIELAPELKPVAYRTFKHHCRRFNMQILMNKERHGMDYYKKHNLTYITQEKLKYAHSLWAADGSGTINYRKRVGNQWRSYKLYAMLISDVASRKIVGYSLSSEQQHEETPAMLKEALKMAVKTGEYNNVFEFISDNHGAFTAKESKELLKHIFNKVRTIEFGNSQANPAETQFRLFKSSLKDLKNFVSSSWGASSVESQANPDYIDISALPSYDEAVLQFADLVKRWNEGKLRDGTTPKERFAYKHPECKSLDDANLRQLYGNKTSVELGRGRGFVSLSRSNGYENYERFDFEIPDYHGTGSERIAKLTAGVPNPKVSVVWDDFGADLYNEQGDFILTCLPTQKASASHAEATSESLKALWHHQKRKAQQLQSAQQYAQDIEQIAQGLEYSAHIALNGNKESYNKQGIQLENERLKRAKKTSFALTIDDLPESEQASFFRKQRDLNGALKNGIISQETHKKRISKLKKDYNIQE